MGGWISLIGDVSDFDTRLKKFKKVFSVKGVPDLKVEIRKDYENVKSICWAWREGKTPDVYVKKNQDILLIISGVITDLGPYCSLPKNQDHTIEKVLELWLEHGEKIIDQINGSFSLLFYNQNTKQALIFSDRFASRSAWFCKENGIWIIGNFPSAIASVMKNTPKLDPAGLWSLFHAGRQIGNRGLFSNIHALLAGQKAVLSSGNQPLITKWWKIKYQPEFGISPCKWGYRLANAINNSANLYKKVSKSPYLFLSGGLDSRIAAAALKKPLRALTLCTNPNAETRIASMVSRTIGLECQTIFRSPYWYFNTMNASALISSGIYLNHHTHFIIPVQNVSSENPEAEFLLGDLLENLNKHYFSIPADQQLNFTPDNIGKFLYSCVPYTIKDVNHIGRHFNKKLRKTIEERYTSALRDYAHSLMEVSEDHADRFDAFLRWANVGITPTYNMTTCIWPLAKERNICFDNELNGLSLKIPSYLRGAGVLHKWILYFLCKMLLLIPDANTFLPPVVPKNINHIAVKIRPSLGKLQRSLIKKKPEEIILKTSGSWLFLHEMYRKDQLYREQIENMINDKSVFPPELFDLDRINKTWEEYLAGNIRMHFEIEALRSFGSLQKMIPCNSIDF